jgi:hypothetical protein
MSRSLMKDSDGHNNSVKGMGIENAIYYFLPTWKDVKIYYVSS